MSRSLRRDKIDPRTIQIVHTISRTTRACRLLGDDPLSGKNCDHRKGWIEQFIKRFAAHFAIDVLSYSVLCNHYHQMLRSRPDVARRWDDTEVARRWLMICPKRKDAEGNPLPPSNAELDSIRNTPSEVAEIRLRLSDISWWMRLMNQRVAQSANREDDAQGRFFADRFKSVPLVDEQAVLACSIYVDLNWIRACMAETIEMCDFTSVKCRLSAFKEAERMRSLGGRAAAIRELVSDSFLAPIELTELTSQAELIPKTSGMRCSDNGFLPMSTTEYFELLDWSARQVAKGKPGYTPTSVPSVLDRLGIKPSLWGRLISEFSELFPTVAGNPSRVDEQRGFQSGSRFYVRRRTRELFAQAS